MGGILTWVTGWHARVGGMLAWVACQCASVGGMLAWVACMRFQTQTRFVQSFV